MKINHRLTAILLALALAVSILVNPSPAFADSAAEITSNAPKALQDLLAKNISAKMLSTKAKGILVFPRIIKGGIIIGGQHGEGALLVGGNTAGYYNSVAASYGLQAGVQKFGYALFLMTPDAMNYLNTSSGWEVGVGPSIVVVDEGTARAMTTTTAKSDIYAFFFSQKGLMAGLGLPDTKITKIDKK